MLWVIGMYPVAGIGNFSNVVVGEVANNIGVVRGVDVIGVFAFYKQCFAAEVVAVFGEIGDVDVMCIECRHIKAPLKLIVGIAI